ncbi:hypothetical protein [Actinopolymorpha pittospori]|uniref:Uncharacterized protein n=1 Tax=Actinopolymorpha pittospori TaxID=648752 RepID=A0A927MRJ4_9ACTN|nr:hypothetical protein [Actinopolymorpha pittospori]MBE1605036.1 hypothetical protein [Actinopolymorpha pittospori]
MEEDVLACQKVLHDGLPESVPAELDDQHPFIPLGVDIDGDVAAVALVVRWMEGPMAGRPGIQKYAFRRCGGEWVYLGGGGGNVHDYPLRNRRPAGEQRGGYLRPCSLGQSLRDRDRIHPPEASWVFSAELQASIEVERVQIDHRTLPVPFHGHVLVVWSTPKPPPLTALAADGTPLASVDLTDPASSVR